MNQDPQHPPMNGNDDLAKTLNEGLQFEETPMPGAAPVAPSAPAAPEPPQAPATPAAAEDDDMKMPSMDPDAGDPDNEPFVPPTLTSTPPVEEPKEEKPMPKIDHGHKNSHAKAEHDEPKEDTPAAPASAGTGDSELDGLKASALEELRPLVGKLNLPAEERFDTLLLIIRSTDDQSLLGEAHDAAKEIADDSRRAQALLDIIKEIDYFSSKR